MINKISLSNSYSNSLSQNKVNKNICNPSFKGFKSAHIQKTAAISGISSLLAVLEIIEINKLIENMPEPKNSAPIKTEPSAIPKVKVAADNAEKTKKRQLAQLAKKEEAQKIEQEKIAQKNALKTKKMIDELNKYGYKNITELNNGILQFEYEGTIYQIRNKENSNHNLYKALLKGIQYESLPKEVSLKVIGEYASRQDCDWLFSTQHKTPDNLLKFLTMNPSERKNPYLNKLINKMINNMKPEEFDEIFFPYRTFLTDTPKGQERLKELKNENPKKYIEIVSPDKLNRSEEGRAYLKKYAPDELYGTKEYNKKASMAEYSHPKLLYKAIMEPYISSSSGRIVGSKNFDGTYNAPIGTDMSSFFVPDGSRMYYGGGDLRNGSVHRSNYYDD